MDYHPGASAPFPLDEGQLRSILATENGRKLPLLLQKMIPRIGIQSRKLNLKRS